MTDRSEIERAIGAYLEKVAAELANAPPDEKDDILQGVESHIYDALEKRFPGPPTMAGLELVLAEMAPPSSYAQGRKEYTPPAPAPAPPQAPRLCWYPVVGLVLTPFAIALAGVVISIGIAMIAPALQRGAVISLEFLALCVAIGATTLALPVISTALGLVGISRIRASRGALYGMPLAVAVTLFFPLAVFDVLAAAVGLLATRFLIAFIPGLLKLVFLPLVLALIVWADVVASKRVWRWANRPAGQGQPA